MDEQNLTDRWLQRDIIRWIAGALAGLLAGAMAIALAMIISSAMGMEFWFPLKLMSTTVLGSSATEIGMHLGPIVIGALIYGILCAFLGTVYAHFTFTNLLTGLMGMGLVWGVFSWIFIWNLFLPSFRPILAARIPSGPVFAICLVFGLALTSVAFFDRALRGK